MNYYLDVIKKYVVFTGRATRTEYWMFSLINVIILIVLYAIGFAMHSLVLYILYELALVLPSLAVGFRRLHDTNHSGWWCLIGLIPLVGAIILIVFLATDSQAGQNKYGPNPKGV